MGRHPDPRSNALAADPADPTDAVRLAAPGDAAARPRRSGPVGRLAAAAIAVVLVAWAGLSLAGVVTGGRLPGFVAVAADGSASPAPSEVPASPAASPPVIASADPSPSTAPSAAPRPPPAPADPGEPAARPRVTTIPVGDRLQAALDRDRARLGIPGVSVTVIFRDGTTWTGHSGLANVKGKVAVDDETAFAVGSVSKTYTAALMLALAEDGKIKLDAPGATYLPKSLPLDRRITVRMLLDHTSGLDDYFLHPPIDVALQKQPAVGWSVKRTLSYVKKPYFPPGAGWHYSNTNYLYLGLIAERVTGSSLGKALHDRFFGPLSLDTTWYQTAEKPRAPTAHGYRFVGSAKTAPPIDLADGTGVMPFMSVVTAAGGAGSIAATSSDAAQWARLLYSGNVLGPEMTAAMFGDIGRTAGYRPSVPYGLGVQAFPINGRPTVGHSGRLLGFRAAVRYLPDEGTTIAVLTNQSRADPGVIVRDLLGVVFAPEPDCFRCQGPT
jgi:D-alanyl-D-alanine carboxypeptidase